MCKSKRAKTIQYEMYVLQRELLLITSKGTNLLKKTLVSQGEHIYVEVKSMIHHSTPLAGVIFCELRRF